MQQDCAWHQETIQACTLHTAQRLSTKDIAGCVLEIQQDWHKQDEESTEKQSITLCNDYALQVRQAGRLAVGQQGQGSALLV